MLVSSTQYFNTWKIGVRSAAGRLWFLMNMADSNMDTGTTTSEMVAEEVSLFSTTDMILFKKKKKEK